MQGGLGEVRWGTNAMSPDLVGTFRFPATPPPRGWRFLEFRFFPIEPNPGAPRIRRAGFWTFHGLVFMKMEEMGTVPQNAGVS